MDQALSHVSDGLKKLGPEVKTICVGRNKRGKKRVRKSKPRLFRKSTFKPTPPLGHEVELGSSSRMGSGFEARILPKPSPAWPKPWPKPSLKLSPEMVLVQAVNGTPLLSSEEDDDPLLQLVDAPVALSS